MTAILPRVRVTLTLFVPHAATIVESKMEWIQIATSDQPMTLEVDILRDVLVDENVTTTLQICETAETIMQGMKDRGILET